MKTKVCKCGGEVFKQAEDGEDGDECTECGRIDCIVEEEKTDDQT